MRENPPIYTFIHKTRTDCLLKRSGSTASTFCATWDCTGTRSSRRMAEARRLLLQSDASLDEIAEQVGFSEPDGFARRFRQIDALTPAAWRRVHRGMPPR